MMTLAPWTKQFQHFLPTCESSSGATWRNTPDRAGQASWGGSRWRSGISTWGCRVRAKSGQSASIPPLTTSLCLADLDGPLPFRDNQFDRVLCNLLIGYLWDPIFTMRELIRVLSPNGRIILTNVKSFANLSQMSLIATAQSGRSDEQEAIASLLLNWGMINHGERQGLFRFFTRQQLVTLLRVCGVTHPKISTAFANQAFIAVFEKSAIIDNA